MSRTPFGNFSSGYSFLTDKRLTFDELLDGVMVRREFLVAGDNSAVRSQNYDPDNAVGWAIFGDGSATFHNVTVYGDIISGNWDGADPANLTTGPDQSGTAAGYYGDSNVGTWQMRKLFVAGASAYLELDANQINMFSGAADEAQPSTIYGEVSPNGNPLGGTDSPPGLHLFGPQDTNAVSALSSGRLSLVASDDTYGHTAAFFADQIYHWIQNEVDATSSNYLWKSTSAGIDLNSGVLTVPLGSAAAPTYSFTGRTDQGMFSSSTVRLGFSVGGTERFRVQGGGVDLPSGGNYQISGSNLTMSDLAAYALNNLSDTDAGSPVDGQVLTWVAANAKWEATAASGVSDHGALSGLGDDDHTQYIKANGTRAFTGDQDFVAGSAGTPSITFGTASGFFSGGAGEIGFGDGSATTYWEYDNTSGFTINGVDPYTNAIAWLTLDSSAAGGNYDDQVAGISIGESGFMGASAAHLVYEGDGYFRMGGGAVTLGSQGTIANEALRMSVTSGDVRCDSTWTMFGAAGAGDYSVPDTDLVVGDTADYGLIALGDSIVGMTSRVTGNLDFDQTFVIVNKGTGATSNIGFAFMEGVNVIRFAIPYSGVGNATYNPRSMLLAGPAPVDDTCVTVGYWQTSNSIFDNLACDTSGTGADLGVQNDLEVEGDIFTDSIKGSTNNTDVNIVPHGTGKLTYSGDEVSRTYKYLNASGTHTPSSTGAETVATEIIADPGRQVDIFVVAQGHYDDNTNASMNAQLWPDISTDGGSTWGAGTISKGRQQCGSTAGRYGSVSALCAVEGVTPTGAIHVRLQSQVNATGGAWDATQFHVEVQ